MYAINNLYSALGSPPLPGWVPNGGDPCTESWQGVQCIGSNITAMYGNLLSNSLNSSFSDFQLISSNKFSS